jgi:phosphoribosyl 1,2-cyclic phosphodiesterase
MPRLSFDLTFLGTGVSHSIPKLDHALDSTVCAVCADAVKGGVLSKNKRNNISACIRFFDSSSEHDEATPSPYAVAVIDVGKTFRDSVLSWFGGLHVAHIDSVLILHKHADAIGGLDDLRDLQRIHASFDSASGLSTFTPTRSLHLVSFPNLIEPKKFNSIVDTEGILKKVWGKKSVGQIFVFFDM